MAHAIEEAGDDASLDDWLAVRNAVRWRLPMRRVSLDHMRARYPAGSNLLVRAAGGRALACGYVSPNAWRDPALRIAICDICVLPGERRRGIGGALYREISRRAHALGLAVLEGAIDEDVPEALAFAEQRGFREVSREQRVELDVTAADPGPPAPPPGVALVTLVERPDTQRGIWEVDAEATPDIPGATGEVVPGYEEWRRDFEGPWTWREGTVVALAGDEVVGFGQIWRTADPTRAGHGMLGVRRSWRGQGIGAAIKRAQIAIAREHGITSLTTYNELRNEPVRRINEQLGYRRRPDSSIMQGPPALP